MKLERVLVLEYESSPVADPEITVITKDKFLLFGAGRRTSEAAEDKASFTKSFPEFHGFERYFSKHCYFTGKFKMQQQEKVRETTQH
jgi:hypothetical protein